jgi:predicted metal-dependent hydrolase
VARHGPPALVWSPGKTGRSVVTEAYIPGDPPIEITLRRTDRARRMTLRVSRIDGRVTLSLPRRASEAEAMAFARGREAWLRQMLQGLGQPIRPVLGGVLPVEGRDRPILARPVRGVRLLPEGLAVPDDAERLGIRLAAFLKVLARDRLQAASDRHAAALGRGYSGLALRDTRSRWGSCASSGRLMYSWRLIMAPPEVLDYVAAHEIAHLAEMNHGPDFWRLVESLCPGHAARRQWLGRHGTALHRWRFTD